MHAMSVEQAIDDFLHVCYSPYNFFRKPTVALYHNGINLKCLLEQRWTGRLVTVTASLSFFLTYNIASPKNEYFKAHKAETRIEAFAPLREVQEQSFLFVTKMLHKVCIAI